MKKITLLFMIFVTIANTIPTFTQEQPILRLHKKNDQIQEKHSNTILQVGNKLVDSICHLDFQSDTTCIKFEYEANNKVLTYYNRKSNGCMLFNEKFQYNTKKKLSETISEFYDKCNLNLSIKAIYEYDVYDSLINLTVYHKTDADWALVNKITHSYDSKQRLISDSSLVITNGVAKVESVKYYSGFTSADLPTLIEYVKNDTLYKKEFLTYHSSGQILTDSISSFVVQSNPLPSYWVTKNYTEYSYDSLNRIISKHDIYRNVPTDWAETYKTYTYSGNKEIIYCNPYYDEASSITKVYNSYGQPESVEVYWAHTDDSQNIPNILQNITDYYYDTDNQLLFTSTKFYTPNNINETYNFPEDALTSITLPFNDMLFYVGDNTYIFYKQPTVVENTKSENDLTLEYISDDFINIIGINEQANFRIFDITGSCNQQGETTGPIKITQLNQGVYFIRILDKCFKFLKLK